jgi:hypothetical protein
VPVKDPVPPVPGVLQVAKEASVLLPVEPYTSSKGLPKENNIFKSSE